MPEEMSIDTSMSQQTEIVEQQEEIPTEQNEVAEEKSLEKETDYSLVVEDDLESLRSQFPELEGINDILELKNPLRYAALRDLGLTPAEAYLATEGRSAQRDNRAHLKTSVPKSAANAAHEIPKRELEMARELFSDLSDREIHKLYRKVKG